MSFDLNNIGTTYQRAMVNMFHDMIHECNEVYVDDILAKSIAKDDHILDSRKIS